MSPSTSFASRRPESMVISIDALHALNPSTSTSSSSSISSSSAASSLQSPTSTDSQSSLNMSISSNNNTTAASGMPSSSSSFLPLPISSASGTPSSSSNHSRSSLVLQDVASDNGFALEDLPLEVKKAAISIAADGSFVETPSGPAARELKRIFDQRFGVGVSVRSPYAITAFVNQHGKQMFRIGRRELEAPAASAAGAEDRVLVSRQNAPSGGTSSSTGSGSNELTTSPSGSSSSKHGKRASRMSVHAFLPPGMPWSSSSSTSSTNTSNTSSSHSSSHHRPQTAATPSSAPRKLRKTRSNSDMFSDAHHSQRHHHHSGVSVSSGGAAGIGPGSSATLGRQHSQSVTEADMPRYHNASSSSSSSMHRKMPDVFTQQQQPQMQLQKHSGSSQSHINANAPSTTTTTDMFYEIMDWLPSSPGHRRHHQLPLPSDQHYLYNQQHQTSQHQLLQHHRRTFSLKPFGNGVSFDSPSQKQSSSSASSSSSITSESMMLDMDFLPPPQLQTSSTTGQPGRFLREMQSFESGLTARQDDGPGPFSDGEGGGESSNGSRRQSLALGAGGFRSRRWEDRDTRLAMARQSSVVHLGSKAAAAIMGAGTKDKERAQQEGTKDEGPSQESERNLTLRPPTPPPPNLSASDAATHESTKTTAPSPDYTLSPETQMQSRYSTEVFDVLQTYRGLPLLDKLSSEDAAETTVIKLSLSAEDTAAPRDDPRFVIWGELVGHHFSLSSARGGGRAADEMSSISQGSVGAYDPSSGAGAGGSGATTGTSSVASSSVSRKRSTKSNGGMGQGQQGGTHHHMSVPSVQISSHTGSVVSTLGLGGGERGTKMLLAATIERWIAQLTSDLNYDELLNFFLTYRTYVSSVDLCHLLIARFHWSLEKPASPKDELSRRVVRLRTFVAIRYWVLTFFTVDFLPNRELRIVVAGWLNTLARDPVLRKHQDGVNTVKKLKRILNECKKTHAKIGSSKPAASGSNENGNNNNAGSEGSKPASTHVLGEKFAEAIRQTSSKDEDSDLDLDFDTNDTGASDTVGMAQMAVNAHLSAAHISAAGAIAPSTKLSIVPPPRTTRTFASSSGIGAVGSADDNTIPAPFIASPTTLPIHHNTLSRVFVNTIGRLGRWKRVLNSRAGAVHGGGGGSGVGQNGGLGIGRSPLRGAGCAGVSAFDLELTVSRDLLEVNGGVEKYLQMIEPAPPAVQASPPVKTKTSASAIAKPKTTKAAAPVDEVLVISAQDSEASVPEVSKPAVADADPSGDPSADKDATLVDEDRDDASTTDSVAAPSTQSRDSLAPSEIQVDTMSVRHPSIASYHSGSSESFGAPIQSSSARHNYPWGFDVVSIDELDLSDTSSDEKGPVGGGQSGGGGGGGVGPAAPPGLRRPPRRLPLRREFEFAPRPESVSSMGIVSRDSMASETSSTSSMSMPGLGGNIQQWQMNALIDSLSDDDEQGDVEAALKRLEGEINPRRQREKESKVDGWVKNIQKRMAMGDFGDNTPRFLDDSDEEGDGEESRNSSSSRRNSGSSQLLIVDPQQQAELVRTPVPTQVSHLTSPGSPSRGSEAKPMLEDVVPIEILQSRVPANVVESPPPMQFSPPSRFGPADLTASSAGVGRIHRSMVFMHRADTLAEHFSMIDRELIMGVKFEELILGDWMACQEVNVLDWGQYLKDRARWKAESRFPEKTSALAAVRARFNLMANFTISEIVLTRPSERPILVGKFIRIAWKAYSRSNFSTLVAIISGLKSEWVAKAMRKSWGKVGMWETRMFNDLKEYTSSADNFRYLRHAVDSIADAKALDDGSRAQSSLGGGAEGRSKAPGENKLQQPSACIPFIGVYLSQLHDLSRLPDLIDPTAPNETVGIDPVTSNFDAPAHPEVFDTLAPLPPSLQLEPLINVHKQRMIAGVIKSVVAGQHLASKVNFAIDKKLFNKCTRLTALDSQSLQRALNKFSD